MRKKNRKYAGYDYERLHTELIDCNEIEVIDVTKGCIYETKTITSGVIREVEIYPTFNKDEIPSEWKVKYDREAQTRFNDKRARKYFIRKINTNFGRGDYFVTLTYEKGKEPKTYEEAKKNIKTYIRRLNRKYEREQRSLGISKSKIKRIKYVYVIEHSVETNKIRCHYHLIMNSVLPMEVVESQWTFGRRNNIRRLDPDEKWLTGLAEYLSKDPKGKKRWVSSRNLKNPRLTVSASKFSKKKINNMTRYNHLIEEEMLKTNPGYIFIGSEVRINTYNGKPYIYALMRKLD